MDGTSAAALGGAGGRYAAVPYFSLPHRASDPDRAAVVGRLHGLYPPDVGTARVVELACGDGGNLLSLAAGRPDASFVGYDLEETAIARGRELSAEAGIDNVELRVADLRELRPEDLGGADYVIAHGLLSWSPPDVREAMFALAGAILDEDGIFILSYNALPGWYQWMAARDIAQRATAGQTDGERAAEVAVAALREAAGLHGRDDAYRESLLAAAERYERQDPWMLYHDDLNPHCTPFALADVVGQARAHGLRYLDEAMPDQWWRWKLARPLVDQLRQQPDPMARQQVADYVTGVDFKSTLLVPAAAEPSADVDPMGALELEIGRIPHVAEVPTGAAAQVRALFEAIAPERAGALSVPVGQAGELASLKPKHAIPAAFRLVADGQAVFRCYPPRAVARAGERPRASRLARAQARHAEMVATLTHERAQLPQPVVRALVSLADGSRDRDALARDVAAAGAEWGFQHPADKLAPAMDTFLARLGDYGLLEA